MTGEEIRQVLDEELPADYPEADRLRLTRNLLDLELKDLRLELEKTEREIRVLKAELRREQEIDELEARFEG